MTPTATTPPSRNVYLHVGLPKTGTTSLQHALGKRKGALLEHGVLFPGRNHYQQRRAVYDLMGRRIPGADEKVAGAFRALIAEIQAFYGPTVVVSEELLGLARPRHARRLARALPAHQLHVVVGVRDLGRTLLSAWQQEVVRGQTATWAEFMSAVRDPAQGARTGVAFWLRHDVLRVLDAWETVVPRTRVHLITVPSPGAPPDELFDRFSRVVGLGVGTLAADRSGLNQSLGAIGVEVVRRLNAHLRDMPQRQYIHALEHGIRPGLADLDDRPLRLPIEDLKWVEERAAAIVAELRRRDHSVEGDLDELRPQRPHEGDEPSARRLDDITGAELLHGTGLALAGLSRAHGALFRQYRRAFIEQRGEDAAALERLGSAARAQGFRAMVAALEHADRNRAVAWAARLYLRRTSSL